MRRNLVIIAVVVLVAVVVLFPTAHTRHIEELVETLDSSRTLEDGESLEEIWTNMQDNTRIKVNITSNENVQVFLIGINGSDIVDIYSLMKKVHTVQHTRKFTSYNVTVWNPIGVGNGSAGMSGSIEAYHVYEVAEWLPWWMH